MSFDNASKIESKGYNRGLILGFTMAESLLLVVFCLLLVTAALIAKERARSDGAILNADRLQKELIQKTQELKKLETQLVSLTASLAPSAQKELDEDWRELVLAKDTYRELKQKLAENDPEKLLARVEDLISDESTLRNEVEAKAALEDKLAKALVDAEQLRAKQMESDLALASTKKENKPHEWPPIISLSEASGNYFRSGSAELEVSFAEKLNGNIAAQIAANLKNYGADIVEIIGHTDEQPLSRLTSNMDKNSIDVLSARKAVASLIPADNAGLGLARAISVANVLKENKALAGVTVLPLSAAQLILPGDTLTIGEAGAVEARRRIEIRIRRRETPIQ